MAKAVEDKAELLKQQPNMTIARLNRLRQSNNPIYSQQREVHNLQGLRMAGIPEN